MADPLSTLQANINQAFIAAAADISSPQATVLQNLANALGIAINGFVIQCTVTVTVTSVAGVTPGAGISGPGIGTGIIQGG